MGGRPLPFETQVSSEVVGIAEGLTDAEKAGVGGKGFRGEQLRMGQSVARGANVLYSVLLQMARSKQEQQQQQQQQQPERTLEHCSGA